MRIRLALLAFLIAAPALADDAPTTTQPEPINPARRACKLIGADELARFGATMETIKYTYKSGLGMTACLWKGRDKIEFGVEHFPQGSNGVGNEAQPAAFHASIKAVLAQGSGDALRPLPGVGDGAYRSNRPKNPMQQVLFVKGDATASVMAVGLSDAELEALAKSVASRM